jgi:hypothetical protein
MITFYRFDRQTGALCVLRASGPVFGFSGLIPVQGITTLYRGDAPHRRSVLDAFGGRRAVTWAQPAARRGAPPKLVLGTLNGNSSRSVFE